MPQKLQTLLERPQDRLAEQDAALRAAAERSLIAWKRRQQTDEDLSQNYTLEQSQQHFRAQIAHQNWMRQHAPPEGLQTRSSDFPESSARADGLGGADGARGSRRVTQAEALERHLALKFARADGEKGHSTADSSAIVGRLGTAQTLEPAVQSVLERHLESEGLDADLSSLKVHPSSKLAQQYDADALVSGGEIHFAVGQFQPQSLEGQQLLVHEAVHAVQQAQGRVSDGLDSDPALEGEAAKVASSLTAESSSDPKVWFAQAEKLFKSYRADKDSEGRESRLLERLDALPDLERSKVLSRVQQKLRPFERDLLQEAGLEGAQVMPEKQEVTPPAPNLFSNNPLLERIPTLNSRSSGILFTYGLKRSALHTVHPLHSLEQTPTLDPFSLQGLKQFRQSPLRDAAVAWQGQVSKHLAPHPQTLELTTAPIQVASPQRIAREWLQGILPRFEDRTAKNRTRSASSGQRPLGEPRATEAHQAEHATDPLERWAADFSAQMRGLLGTTGVQAKRERPNQSSKTELPDPLSVLDSELEDKNPLDKGLRTKVKVGTGPTNAVQRKIARAGQGFTADPVSPVKGLAGAHLSQMRELLPQTRGGVGAVLHAQKAERSQVVPALEADVWQTGGLVSGPASSAAGASSHTGFTSSRTETSSSEQAQAGPGLEPTLSDAEIMAQIQSVMQILSAAFSGASSGASQTPVSDIDAVSNQVERQPEVPLSGESDPAQLESQRDADAAEVAARVQAALTDTLKDFELADLAPKSTYGTLEGNPGCFTVPEIKEVALENDGIPAELWPIVDAEMDPALQPKLEGEADKVQAAQLALDSTVSSAQSEHTAQIVAAETEAQQGFEAKVRETDTAVEQGRADWQAEIDKTEQDYHKDVKAELDKGQADIGNKQKAARDKKEDHYKDGDAKIAQEKANAREQERLAREEAKRRKEEQEQRERDWWVLGWLVNRVQDFFQWLADTLNAIWNALRDIVKGVISFVKDLIDIVVDILAAAVKFIIDVVAAQVKVLVRVVLFAFPEIAERWCAWIDTKKAEAQTWIGEKAEGLKTFLKDKLDALGDDIDLGLSFLQGVTVGALEAMSYFVVGDLGGGLKAGAKRILESLGDVGKQLWALLNSAWEKFKADPLGFVGLVFTVIGRGFELFFAHFWENFKAGLVSWMTGKLGQAHIRVPKDDSFGSVVTIVLEVLGLTYADFRPILVRALGESGEAQMKKLELEYEWIKALLEGGIDGLAMKLDEVYGQWREALYSSFQTWLMNEVINVAIQKVATFLIPVAGWIEAFQSLVSTVKFVMAIVANVVQALGAALSGNIEPAAALIESALTGAIPAAIDWLAGLLGLNNLAATIKETIGKIRAEVAKGLKVVADWVVNFGPVRILLGLNGVMKTDKEDHDKWLEAGKTKLLKAVDNHPGDLTLEVGAQIAAQATREKGYQDEMRLYGIFDELSAVPVSAAKQGIQTLEGKDKTRSPGSSAFDEAEFAFAWKASKGWLPVKRTRTTKPPTKPTTKPGETPTTQVGGGTATVSAFSSMAGSTAELSVYGLETQKKFATLEAYTPFLIREKWEVVANPVDKTTPPPATPEATLYPGLYYKIKLPQQERAGLVAASSNNGVVMLAPEDVKDDALIRFKAVEPHWGLIRTVKSFYKEIPEREFADVFLLNFNYQSIVRQYVLALGKINPDALVKPGATSYKEMDLKDGPPVPVWLPSNPHMLALLEQYNITSLEIVGQKVVGDIEALKKKVSDELKKLGGPWEDVYKLLEGLIKGDKAVWEKMEAVGHNLVKALNEGFNGFVKGFSLGNLLAKVLTGQADAVLPEKFDFATATPSDWTQAALGLVGLGSPQAVANRIMGLLPGTVQSKAAKAKQVLGFVTDAWNSKGGFVGAIEDEIKVLTSDLKTVQTDFENQIKNFVTQQVAWAVGELAAKFIPGAGQIVAVLKGVYDALMFVWDALSLIREVLSDLSSTVQTLVSGSSDAAKQVTRTLNRLMLTGVELLLNAAGKLLGRSNLWNNIQDKLGMLKTRVEGFFTKLLTKVTGNKKFKDKIDGKDEDKPGSSGQNDTVEFKKYLSAHSSKYKVTEARVLSYDDQKAGFDKVHAAKVAEGLELLESTEKDVVSKGTYTLKKAAIVAEQVQRSSKLNTVKAVVVNKKIRYDWTASDGAQLGEDVLELEVGDIITVLTDTKEYRVTRLDDTNLYAESVRGNTKTLITFPLTGNWTFVRSGATEADPDLIAAVQAAGGVVAFMYGIADGKTYSEVDRAKLEGLWKKQANENYLKGLMRAADKGKHEWIPLDLIMDVINRASGVDSGVKAIKWVELQNKFRTPTKNIVFDPTLEATKDKTEDGKYHLVSGHTGALYTDPLDTDADRRTKPKIKGQSEFHKELNTQAFRLSNTVTEAISAAEAIYKKWAWTDASRLPQPIPPQGVLDLREQDLPGPGYPACSTPTQRVQRHPERL